MEPLLTSAEMQACDRYAINVLRIPALTLMENAGRGVVEMIERYYGSVHDRSILICCGKGNNGGDGFVIARHLHHRGARITVVLIEKRSRLQEDAKIQFTILKNIQKHAPEKKYIQIIESPTLRTLRSLPGVHLIVDAILGTGFNGNLRTHYKEIIKWMNEREEKKVSVDVPSGINVDNGTVSEMAIKADLTITIQHKKAGLHVGQAKDYTGKLEVINIGFLSDVLDLSSTRTYLLSLDDVRRILPRRSPRAHKHSVGKIFALAGSRGLTGAAALSSLSAMRAGAGAVTLGTPSSVYPILARKLTEVMVDSLPETTQGSVSLAAIEKIQKFMLLSDVSFIGPGLSRHPETIQLIHKLVQAYEGRLVIDADGLNAFEGLADLLKKHKSKDVIITPHIGELSRLTGLSSNEIEQNRIMVARDVAYRFKLTLVLKGAPTVTATPDGSVYVNPTGNAGMATAGSGDVLTGIIAALWGQGMPAHEAAYSGVFIHGFAGDLARDRFGEKSLLASDMLKLLPEAFRCAESEVVE